MRSELIALHYARMKVDFFTLLVLSLQAYSVYLISPRKSEHFDPTLNCTQTSQLSITAGPHAMEYEIKCSFKLESVEVIELKIYTSVHKINLRIKCFNLNDCSIESVRIPRFMKFKPTTFLKCDNKSIKCVFRRKDPNFSRKDRRREKSVDNYSYFTFPFGLTFVLVVVVAFVILKYLKKPKKAFLSRRRKFDAFVCYSYKSEDKNFAESIIRTNLERNHSFRLCIHRRDFLAGWDIKWNIMNAIRNSNSAILIMSQNFLNSLWCLEEFEDCYMEHMKDPAFKLFVVMMQPPNTLRTRNEYIKSFLSRRTYLEKDDSTLFDKLSSNLQLVKGITNMGK